MRLLSAGIDRIDKTLFCNVDNPDYRNKPSHGGLWASTFDRQRKTSSWLEWVKDANYHLDRYGHCISFKLKKSAKVYYLNTVSDYTNLLDVYGYDYKPFHETPSQKSIDFVKLSEDYDALYIGEELIFDYELRYASLSSGINGFYCYDVDTWLIFNLECINMGSVMNHNFNLDCRYNDI